MKDRLLSLSSRQLRDLKRARLAAERSYLRRGDVLGVSAGTKFKNGRPTKVACIQFFVARKKKRIPKSRRLPRMVYGRTARGLVKRSVRFPTDVIQVRSIAFACGAGSQVHAFGEKGTIAAIFQNKVPGDDRFFLLTCAHVAGNVERSPPSEPGLTSECNDHPAFSAETLKNSTQRNGVVEYDIAIAEVDRQSLPVPDLLVVEEGITLTRFIPASQLQIGIFIKSITGLSGPRQGHVHSDAGTVKVILDGRLFRVRNMLVADFPVQPGDSGAVVFKGTDLVGLIVARSPEGLAWFQALEPAVAHLVKQEPAFPLKLFR
jgi:hypothetical protein